MVDKKIFIPLFFLFIGFLLTNDCLAQNNNLKKGAKVNFNLTKFPDGKDFSIGQVAPVFFLVGKRGNFHDMELNSIGMNKTTTVGTNSIPLINTLFNVGLRYQYTYNLTKKEKIIPQIGVSFLSSYANNSVDPQSLYAFDRRTQRTSAIVNLIPQLRFNLKNNFFADISLPLDVISISYVQQRIKNPGIPIRQQTNGGFEIWYPTRNYTISHLRIGAGVKF